MEIITEYKTTALIKRSNQEWLHIVCPRLKDVERIVKQAREMWLDIPHPLTFVEFAEGNYNPQGIKGFLFDDIDRSLQRLARSYVPVIALSLSDDKTESNRPPRSPRVTEYVVSSINQDGSVNTVDATRRYTQN